MYGDISITHSRLLPLLNLNFFRCFPVDTSMITRLSVLLPTARYRPSGLQDAFKLAPRESSFVEAEEAFTSHTSMFLSLDNMANLLGLVGCHTIIEGFTLHGIDWTSFKTPVASSEAILTVLSYEALARYEPSEFHFTSTTSFACSVLSYDVPELNMINTS